MTTLFDATYRLAGFVSGTGILESAATGGSVTTLVDALATFSDVHVGGTLFVKTGDLANKTLVVTSRTGTTQLGFATQTPSDVVAGNLYGLADKDFPRGVLRRAVNEALREYRPVRAEDETLTVVPLQEKYTLPAGVADVKEVWMATATAEPYGWCQLFHWDEADGLLRFPAGFTPWLDGNKLRLVYPDAFAELDADADTLDLEICPVHVSLELIHWAACAHVVETWGMPRYHGDPERDMMNKATKAEAELTQRKRNWHAWQRSARPADY